MTPLTANKPKMVNAPEGLNQVILRKVRRFVFQKRSFIVELSKLLSSQFNANNFQ